MKGNERKSRGLDLLLIIWWNKVDFVGLEEMVREIVYSTPSNT